MTRRRTCCSFKVRTPTTKSTKPSTGRRQESLMSSVINDKRPWGCLEQYISEASYRVKRLTVVPKQRISLQKHLERSEHWVIVSGEGEARIDEKVVNVGIGDTVFVPRGAVHRLANIGADPLIVVETQIG